MTRRNRATPTMTTLIIHGNASTNEYVSDNILLGKKTKRSIFLEMNSWQLACPFLTVIAVDVGMTRA